MTLRFERVVWAYFQERVLRASHNPTENWGLLRIGRIENEIDYDSCSLEHRGLLWKVTLNYYKKDFTDQQCQVYCFARLPENEQACVVRIIQCYKLSFVDQTGREIWTSGTCEDLFAITASSDDGYALGQDFTVPSQRMSEIKTILKEGQSCFLRLSFFDKNQWLQAPECSPKQAKPAPECSPVKAKSDPECSTVQTKNDWAELSQQLKSLLNDKQNFDVSLDVSGRTFGAHKALLMARSPVFDRMFQSNMVEQRTGKVEIPDCDPGAFEVYLQFLYSGIFDAITVDNVSNLHYIATKYDSKSLARECLACMKSNLSVERYSSFVSSVLTGSDSDPSFLEACVQYLANHFKQIGESAEWKSFCQANPLLANELFIKALEVKASSKK